MSAACACRHAFAYTPRRTQEGGKASQPGRLTDLRPVLSTLLYRNTPAWVLRAGCWLAAGLLRWSWCWVWDPHTSSSKHMRVHFSSQIDLVPWLYPNLTTRSSWAYIRIVSSEMRPKPVSRRNLDRPVTQLAATSEGENGNRDAKGTVKREWICCSVRH